MLCATVNAVTTSGESPDRPAEQQQPDEKQQMVRADQDVMDSGRHEPADDRENALPRAGEVFEARSAAIEDRLRERVALRRRSRTSDDAGSYGKRDAAIATVPGARSSVEADAHPDRLPFGEDVGRRPGPREHPAVAPRSRAGPDSSLIMASARDADTTAGSSRSLDGSMFRSCATS